MLYDHHGEAVYSLIRYLLRERQRAEEITQDVFLRVWERADGFDIERGAPRTWILAIARNMAIDALRRRPRHPPESMPDQIGAPTDEAERIAARAALDVALAGLTPMQREVVRLSFYHGYSHRQIAVHLGIPLGTVKSHVRRALRALRKSLES